MSTAISFGSNLQELYSSMRRNKTLRAGANDIGDFIRGYISEGIRFDDAEHILRSAGIGFGERRGIDVPDDPHWPNRPDKDDVLALMCFRADLCRGPS
jgi:hypothetical protein